MKKLFLTILCAAAALVPAAAQETITDNGNGTVTITDSFNFKTIGTTVKNNPQWSVSEDAVVTYSCLNFGGYTSTEPYYLQSLKTSTLEVKEAYLEFTLADYNCQSVTFTPIAFNTNVIINFYAGETLIGSKTIARGETSTPVTFELDAQSTGLAGTKYKLEIENPENLRIQLAAISFVCTPKAEGQWEAPTCNIPDGAWINPGAVIKFSCEEGATVTGTVTYSIQGDDGKAQTAIAYPVENNEYTIPANLGNGYNIKINVHATGAGKNDSDAFAHTYKFNGNKINVSEVALTGVDDNDDPNIAFNYTLTVLNLSVSSVTLQVTATNLDTEETLEFTKVIRAEEVNALADDNADYVLPETLEGSIVAEKLPLGKYSAKMQYRTGSTGAWQEAATATEQGTVSFELNGIPTGVQSVEAATEEAPVYYNLSGLRVEPAKGMGILIRVAGGKATKIVM